MEPTEQHGEELRPQPPVFEPERPDPEPDPSPQDGDGLDDIPEQAAPVEIEAGAAAELRRIDAATGAGSATTRDPYAAPWRDEDFDDSYGMSRGVDDMGEELFEQPTVQRESSLRAPRKLETLEDLYDRYPQIGDGATYLRVMRKMPMTWHGARVGGWLEDLHDQISMGQFAERFGGYSYEVSVRGPHRAGDPDVRERTFATIRVEISGPPLKFRGQGEDNNVQPMQMRPQDDARVRIKELEIEAERDRERERELRRVRDQANRQPGFDPHVIRMLDEFAKTRVEGERNASHEVIVHLREVTARQQETIDQRDHQIAEMRKRLSDVERESALRWREEESRQIRDLKEQHSHEIARLKDDHASRIQSMQGDHERRIDEMEKRHTQETQQIRDMEQRERERLRDDAMRREKILQDDFSRREQGFRDRENMISKEAARREEAIKGDYQLRFETLERQGRRDLDMIRSTESTKATLAETNAANNINMFEREMGRQVQQITELQHENNELRSELSRLQAPKPLMQQIEESHKIAEMTGFKGGTGEAEESWDWKKVVAKVVTRALDKAPETMASIENARAQNQQLAMMERQRMEAARQQQAAAAAGYDPYPMMGAPMQPQQQQRPMQHAPSPPPQWDQGGGPPMPGTAPPVPMPHQGPVMADPPRFDHPIGSGPPPGPTPPPISGEGPGIPQGSAPSFAMGPEIRPTPNEIAQQQLQPQQVQPQQPRQVQQQPSPPVAAVQIQPEHLQRFLTELEDAIKSDGIITEPMFAQEFINEVGPDTTRALMSAFTADGLIDMVSSAKDDAGRSVGLTSVIVNRKGKKFVRQLWVEVARRLG